MRLVKNLLIAGGLSLLLGCPVNDGPIAPRPSATPHRPWAEITFEVEGTGGITQANNITYGRIDTEGNWVEDFYYTTGEVDLPWSYTGTTCTNHSLRLGVSACNTQEEGSLTLRIKDDGKTGIENTSVGNCFLDKIEYYIPSQ